MTPPGSAQSLPRSLAGGNITILEPGNARFGMFDVYLTPDGSGIILGSATTGERPQLIAQDAWQGLLDFLTAARREANRGFAVVSVGYDTLAHLYAQRVLRQDDLLETNTVSVIAGGVFELTIPPRAGHNDELTLRCSPKWNTVRVGRRHHSESDLEG